MQKHIYTLLFFSWSLFIPSRFEKQLRLRAGFQDSICLNRKKYIRMSDNESHPDILKTLLSIILQMINFMALAYSYSSVKDARLALP
jgi:hypothetical protein